jgi:hypothetical protein
MEGVKGGGGHKSENSTILVDDSEMSEETSMKIGDNSSFKVINDYLDKG